MTIISRSSLTARVILMLSLALAGSSRSAHGQSINQRKTIAQALIGGSTLRNGSFASSATSGICGEIPKEQSPVGAPIFVVEFPSDATNDNLQSISFGSNELVSGVTKSTVFHLNVSVRTANGGTPPAYVLNTDQGKPKNTGTATLKNNKGVLTLRVVGQEDMGETIDLTIVCM